MVPVYPIMLGIRTFIISSIVGGVCGIKVYHIKKDIKVKSAKIERQETIKRLKELKLLNTQKGEV